MNSPPTNTKIGRGKLNKHLPPINRYYSRLNSDFHSLSVLNISNNDLSQVRMRIQMLELEELDVSSCILSSPQIRNIWDDIIREDVNIFLAVKAPYT